MIVSRPRLVRGVPAASRASTRMPAPRRLWRASLRNAERESFTRTRLDFEGAMVNRARPKTARPRRALKVSFPRQEPFVPTGQRSRIATRPRLSLAVRETTLMPAKGVAIAGLPGAVERLGAFGVGTAATTESSP